MEISEIESNPKERRLIFQGRGLDVLIHQHLPVEMRDWLRSPRDLVGGWQSRPNEVLQRRDSRCRISNIAALCKFKGLCFRSAKGRHIRGPEIGHCVDSSRILESGDQRVFVVDISFDNFDTLLLQLLSPGGSGIAGYCAYLPSFLAEERVDY